MLPEEEELMVKQQEIVYDTFAQIEEAIDHRNEKLMEGRWFGASNYSSEFIRIPYEAFLPILREESFQFLTEEELPVGYKTGDLFF